MEEAPWVVEDTRKKLHSWAELSLSEHHPNPTFAIGKVLVAKTRISLGLMAAVGRPARDSGVNLSWSEAALLRTAPCRQSDPTPPPLLVPTHCASSS